MRHRKYNPDAIPTPDAGGKGRKALGYKGYHPFKRVRRITPTPDAGGKARKALGRKEKGVQGTRRQPRRL